MLVVNDYLPSVQNLYESEKFGSTLSRRLYLPPPEKVSFCLSSSFQLIGLLRSVNVIESLSYLIFKS